MWKKLVIPSFWDVKNFIKDLFIVSLLIELMKKLSIQYFKSIILKKVISQEITISYRYKSNKFLWQIFLEGQSGWFDWRHLCRLSENYLKATKKSDRKVGSFPRGRPTYNRISFLLSFILMAIDTSGIPLHRSQQGIKVSSANIRNICWKSFLCWVSGRRPFSHTQLKRKMMRNFSTHFSGQLLGKFFCIMGSFKHYFG